ncbi:MAG: LysR family transcriptional regulator [Rhodospirillales bacterium]|jgi:DNA-binding transcriptional LysR family regulator|nr:LysR family transcriptional regulator [Rhodospirillales bacterium]
MSTIEAYQAFVAVIERGSLTAAARGLGRSLQAVSRALAQVEQDLGVELVHRSTRRLEPTPAGMGFYRRIRDALADIEAARVEAAEHATAIGGPMRVGGPSLFGPMFLVPAVAAFLQRHPAVTIDLRLANEFVDLIADRLDLSVRVGVLEDSSLRVRRIAMMRRVFYAAPAYLAERGRPLVPADLARHDCVVRTSAQDSDVWPCTHAGNVEMIHVRGRFAAPTADACNEAVARGLGIGLGQMWQARPLLDQGRAELVLTDFEPAPIAVSVIWPAGPALPARTRLLIDFLVARLGAEQW